MLTTCKFYWKLTKVTHQEKKSAKNETSYVDITDHDSETSCPQISLTDYVERRMVDLSVDDGEGDGVDDDEDSSERSGEDDSSTDNGTDSGEDNGPRAKISAAGTGAPEDDGSSSEDGDNNRAHRNSSRRGRTQTPRPERPPARAAPSNQHEDEDTSADHDELDDMSWWDVMTPDQQRKMAQQLAAATPMAAPVTQTIVLPAREEKPRRKMLGIDDFKGEPGESVEAWLSSVIGEVKNQEHLGGDTYTASELFHGAVPHLKGKAQKWYISLTESMQPDDYTFAFLVERMRAKYGRRDNAWQIQQRLAKRVQQPGKRLSDFADSLLDIGFGKRVPAESYVEAFLNGMNNEIMATHVRASNPQTLEEAVQYAEDKCGEYGEGRKVTDWSVAVQRYRDAAIGDEEAGRGRKPAKAEMRGHIDWKKLGLGFGGDENSPPVYDTSGKAISGLAQNAKKDPLSLAALQTLMTMVGVGEIEEACGQTATTTAPKPKARALEVKAESRTENEDEGSTRPAPTATRGWQGSGPGSFDGHGYGDRWLSRGRGRGGVGGRGFAAGHYGPADNKPIAQRKAESECSYCGQRGHWWRECAIRIAAMGKQEAAQLAAAADQKHTSDAPAAATTTQQGNEQRQNEQHKNQARSLGAEWPRDVAEGDAVVWGKSNPATSGLTWGKSSGGPAADGTPNAKALEDQPTSNDTRATSGTVDTTQMTKDGVEDAPRRPEPILAEGATAVTMQATTAEGDTTKRLTATRAKLSSALMKKQLLVSGGITTAAKRRQLRIEAEQAAARGMLIAELREEHAERAKVMRQKVKRVIVELRELADLLQGRRTRREAQVAAELVRREERRRLTPTPTADGKPKRERKLPDASMVVSVMAQAPMGQSTRIYDDRWVALRQHYEEDVPHIAAIELRRFGQCITRDAPVDIVEGFGGGTNRVLGVWRFVGTTQYQQRITIDALVVDGQGDEFLVGEVWMVQQQVKMDFRRRERKYHDSNGRKVILPSTCHGVSTLTREGRERCAVVRLAKTTKLPTNTRSVIRVDVDAADGTTGIFLPKPGGKRHLMMAPTVDTVRNGMVRIAVMNGEGWREKLPACESLGKWIPIEEDMEIFSMNGELERQRMSEWIATLRDNKAKPLTDEDKLDIGEMEASDRDLVIALLRQYASIVEKKEGCPPLSTTGVEHHINTGKAAPIMFRRRRHAVAENAIIDKEVDEMMQNGVIEEGSGACGFPVVLVKKKDGSVRFCIDYRTLNAITEKDIYPLLRVDETLEALHGTQRLVKAIVEFPTPPDEAQVRRFVALAGYYRRFVPGFGAKMAPLTKLLRQTNKWQGGTEQEQAFSWAKAKLSTKHVLIYPDYRLSFKLTTDASKTGLGAVLSQGQGNGDQPVAYASKVNSEAVAKYGISELECLAVVWAVRLFRPHLYGRKFTIVTDHAALKWLMTTKEPAGRLHRWAQTLQEYDFDILYRLSRENQVADALSRGPTTTVEEGGRREAEPDESLASDSEQHRQRSTVHKWNAPANYSSRGFVSQMEEMAEEIAKRSCKQCGPATDDTTETEIDRAAAAVVQTAVVRRVEAAEMGVVQFTDDDIRHEQAKSVMVQTLKRKAAKWPRGRPRKRATDIAAEHDIDTAIGTAARASTAATVDTTATVGLPARVEIRTAAKETTGTAATPEFTAPDERAPKRRRRQRAVAALNDTIAGRTRWRIRREPYQGVDTDGRAARDDSPRGARAADHALVVSSTHSTATGRHSESSEDGRTHERLDVDLQHSSAVRQFDAEGSEASRQARPQQPEQQPSAETEESETRTYVFVGQGRCGTDSLVGPRPRLPRIPPTATVVEYRRRRYRTRVGRYAMEFEVGYMGDRPDGRADKLWINQKDYEQLYKEGRLRTSRDDSGADEPPGQYHEHTAATAAGPAPTAATGQGQPNRIGDDSYPRGRDCSQISLTDYVERRTVDLSVDDGEDDGVDDDEDSSERSGEDDSSTDNGTDSGEGNGEDDEDRSVDNDQDDSETESEGDRTQPAPERRGSCAERAL
ncbi:unnamed protein product [Phytophthora fragariaefolia]|uniref:Unnamed protein product n=1 Tax=Phytophthora fragariaefolia TaxID=1490495 RepID=A0A9W6TT65_9STRA|nr:unnamed protein product [Phytophthora fragariaefolia]